MNSMIEIAPKEYWIQCTYEEAVLYCFTLDIDGKIGWRLPKKDENIIYESSDDNDFVNIFTWQADSGMDCTMRVRPVRDIV
jgi:hypothetical protein